MDNNKIGAVWIDNTPAQKEKKEKQWMADVNVMKMCLQQGNRSTLELDNNIPYLFYFVLLKYIIILFFFRPLWWFHIFFFTPTLFAECKVGGQRSSVTLHWAFSPEDTRNKAAKTSPLAWQVTLLIKSTLSLMNFWSIEVLWVFFYVYTSKEDECFQREKLTQSTRTTEP